MDYVPADDASAVTLARSNGVCRPAQTVRRGRAHPQPALTNKKSPASAGLFCIWSGLRVDPLAHHSLRAGSAPDGTGCRLGTLRGPRLGLPAALRRRGPVRGRTVLAPQRHDHLGCFTWCQGSCHQSTSMSSPEKAKPSGQQRQPTRGLDEPEVYRILCVASTARRESLLLAARVRLARCNPCAAATPSAGQKFSVHGRSSISHVHALRC